MEHCWEKDVLPTTAGHKSTGVVQCSLPDCVCLPFARSGTAETRGKGTLDLDLIGGTLWLELWAPRRFVHGANTLICSVCHGNSSGSNLEAVSEEGGLVITGSRTGTGETGRLRVDHKPLVVNEIEAEQDAVQIRVHKGPPAAHCRSSHETQCDAPPIP